MLLKFLNRKIENRERILALDLLRGTFLLEIISNHIAWSPSIFTFIGGGGRLPASAAEGFFTISGLLVGYLYGPKILKDTRVIFRKIWKRAGLLYVLSIFFTFLFTAWASLEPESIKYSMIYHGNPLRFVFDTLTLRHTFGWADFLNRYALFMFVAPLAVWLVAKGRAWIVIVSSIAVWLLFRRVDISLPFSTWQLIFMLGIVLGYYLPHLEEWFYKLSKPLQRTIFGTVCITALTTYVISLIVFVFLPILHPHDTHIVNLSQQIILQHFDKDHVAPARFAIGVLWFAALYMTFRRFEKQISHYTFGVLEVFGRQSLFVYGLHALILFFIDMYMVPPPGHTKVVNTIATFIVLTIIYFAAYYRAHITRFGKKILSNRSTTQIP